MDVMHNAASPRENQDEMERREQLEHLLRAEVRASEERLVSIEAELGRLADARERQRQVIEQANALLVALGFGSLPMPPVPPTSPNGTRPARPLGGDFTAGNRSDKTPKRRPEFESVSLLDAARRLLGSGETMRLDDFAEAIFESEDPDQRRAAKGSLRSVMANGVNRGLWTREEAGAFRIASREAEQMTMKED